MILTFMCLSVGLTRCVTLGKWLSLSVPQLSHVWKGLVVMVRNAEHVWLLWRGPEGFTVKCISQICGCPLLMCTESSLRALCCVHMHSNSLPLTLLVISLFLLKARCCLLYRPDLRVWAQLHRRHGEGRGTQVIAAFSRVGFLPSTASFTARHPLMLPWHLTTSDVVPTSLRAGVPPQVSLTRHMCPWDGRYYCGARAFFHSFPGHRHIFTTL